MDAKQIKQRAEEIVRAGGYHEGRVIDFDEVVEMVEQAFNEALNESSK